MYQFGNSVALFLGVEPADIFLYVFLPPLLFEAAVRIDYFIFKKAVARAPRFMPTGLPVTRMRCSICSMHAVAVHLGATLKGLVPSACMRCLIACLLTWCAPMPQHMLVMCSHAPLWTSR